MLGEHDRRTKAYREAAAARGELVLDPEIECAAEFIFEAGFRGVPDKSYWVPIQDIIGAVRVQFPNAPELTLRQWGRAVKAAEPDAKRVLRRVRTVPTRGWAGIKGPNGLRLDIL